MTLSRLRESELLHSTIRQGPCKISMLPACRRRRLAPDVAQQYGVQPGKTVYRPNRELDRRSIWFTRTKLPPI